MVAARPHRGRSGFWGMGVGVGRSLRRSDATAKHPPRQEEAARKAYIQLGPYRSTFDTKDFAEGVRTAALEGQPNTGQIDSFTNVLHDTVKIDEKQALYIYGGRDALLKALAPVKGNLSIVGGGSKPDLVIAHGMVKVKALCTKRILMICRLDDFFYNTQKEKLLKDGASAPDGIFKNPIKWITLNRNIEALKKAKDEEDDD
jgi:hypothetical protein